MSGYRIRILTVPGYIHSPRCFQETADAFEGAFKDLGWYDPEGTPIVFGAHLLEAQVTEGAIIYQTEVIGSLPWTTPAYIARLQRHRVLDYAIENVRLLADCGIAVTHCPIGHHRSLTRLTLQEPDIDVLFYGAKTERRLPILKAVWETGLKCVFLDHTDDWSRRDHYLPRTKILLNIHAYDHAPLEMVRLSYALANRAYIVSELSYTIPGITYAAAEDLPQVCVDMCGEGDWMRKDIANSGFNCFSQRLQADILRSVLA